MTTQINGNTGPALAAIATQTIFIPAGGTFKLTFASGSPTWVALVWTIVRRYL